MSNEQFCHRGLSATPPRCALERSIFPGRADDLRCHQRGPGLVLARGADVRQAGRARQKGTNPEVIKTSYTRLFPVSAAISRNDAAGFAALNATVLGFGCGSVFGALARLSLLHGRQEHRLCLCYRNTLIHSDSASTSLISDIVYEPF